MLKLLENHIETKLWEEFSLSFFKFIFIYLFIYLFTFIYLLLF